MEGNESAPRPEAPTSLRRELLTLALIAALSVGLALVLRLCVAQAYEIRGNSMEPTLHNGDRIVLLKIAPTLIPINVGDIVIFAHPTQPDRDLVKRVVARGGDRVRVKDGQITVNGVQSPHFVPRGYRDTGWNMVLPEGTYFVAGDNRANSQDSRDFGPVTHNLIKGKVWFRWWPLFGGN
jgi:signal peptidase I